ncbi:MAG: VWA domain-containing protein [Gammaproteobacteria bacterium]
MRLWWRDLRLTTLIGAIVLTSISILQPKISVKQNIFEYIFVIDITQSMNARDYRIENLPADRLSFVKTSIRYVLQQLPCNSKAGVALFTSKNVFLLFEPLEICRHYAAIADSLAHIDWRMAWDADSHIARGLYTAIRDIGTTNPQTRLVFFSDGQQTPAAAKDPAFLSKPGNIHGLVVGVGSLQAVPVPKFDRDNLPAGYWLNSTAENRSETGNILYLSALQESVLQRLAGITGLQYHRLETPELLHAALQGEQFARPAPVNMQISWIPALAALALFAAPYLINLRSNHAHVPR